MNKFTIALARLSAACFVLIASALCSGCHYLYDQVGEQKRIPSPISQELPFETSGKIYRVWCGNELQIKSDIHTTYLLLQGVNNPDLGPRIEQKAIDFMHSMIESEQIRAVIVGFDDRKRAIAQVYSGDNHLNIEMIRNGWGRFDGTQFDDSDRFRTIQQRAKQQGLGMWKTSN